MIRLAHTPPPVFKFNCVVLRSTVMGVIFPHIHRFWELGGMKSWGQFVEVLHTTASIHDSWLNDIYYDGWKWWCSNLSFLLCFTWYITIKKGLHSMLCLFILVYIRIFFPFHNNECSLAIVIYFSAQTVPVLASWSPFCMASADLSQVIIILEHYLTFCPHIRCSVFILHCPFPSPVISYLSKEFWFLLVEHSICKLRSGYMMFSLPTGCLCFQALIQKKVIYVLYFQTYVVSDLLTIALW